MAVGLNNSLPPLIIPSPSWDRDNGLVTQPLLLRWNGMKWEPRRAVNTRPMKTLEARISPSSAGRVSITFPTSYE
ncbi:MAG: hypothetical protein DRN03_05930 [Thermoplasmata archaeon]|nr:MAG: hypothetical protein DRN03_05930 [Thermoplasmata archaeon]